METITGCSVQATAGEKATLPRQRLVHSGGTLEDVYVDLKIMPWKSSVLGAQSDTSTPSAISSKYPRISCEVPARPAQDSLVDAKAESSSLQLVPLRGPLMNVYVVLPAARILFEGPRGCVPSLHFHALPINSNSYPVLRQLSDAQMVLLSL